MTRIELEDEELAVLDGQCRDEVQQEVDAAKRRIAYRIRYPDLRPEIAGLIADAVSEAHTNGILIYQEIRINQCDLCGWMGQYPRHRSGPQAGRVDYDKPRATTPGIELAKRFVTLQGSVTLGGCTRCVNQALPALREELRGVRAQLPDNLRYRGEPRFQRFGRVHCTRCDWNGHEGQMGSRPTIFADGTYPAVCPSCHAENVPLGTRPIENIGGFDVVELASSGSRS